MSKKCEVAMKKKYIA